MQRRTQLGRAQTLNYFGSVNSRIIEQDFTRERRCDFTVRKEILWESETATDAEVRAIEIGYIRELRSNDPAIGYNRWPRHVAEPGQPEPGRSLRPPTPQEG
jgi:hypothetical protein